ncbi:MAG TPA: hypothetical protein ENJ18_18860 [Nannocystis exedens]|nr:hypothetical protein [Nannocystis exedens]
MSDRPLPLPVSLRLLAIGILCALACERSPADTVPTNAAQSVDPDVAPTEQRQDTNIAEPQIDAAELAWKGLYQLRRPTGDVLLFDRAITEAPSADLEQLAAALRSISTQRTKFDRKRKIILQNDVWGLFIRLESASESLPGRAELGEIAAALIRDLSLESSTFRAPSTPLLQIKFLSEDAGWYEVASELPAFNHELAYGSRRIFRLFRRRGSEDLALASHLVALDRDGATRPSDVIGEVEILHFSNEGNELTSAEVYELNRLSIGGPALQSIALVAQIPGEGADFLIAEFDPPEAITELPCLRCHHDGIAMSLPNPTLPPRWRDAGVLRRAQLSATNLWPGLASDGRSRQ